MKVISLIAVLFFSPLALIAADNGIEEARLNAEVSFNSLSKGVSSLTDNPLAAPEPVLDLNYVAPENSPTFNAVASDEPKSQSKQADKRNGGTVTIIQHTHDNHYGNHHYNGHFYSDPFYNHNGVYPHYSFDGGQTAIWSGEISTKEALMVTGMVLLLLLLAVLV